MTHKSRNIELTQVTQWEDGEATRVEDYLAAEEPLEMRAGRYFPRRHSSHAGKR